MPSKTLPNYLRARRKQLALSQNEVAFLLGAESGSKVCRYERLGRLPGLETALAYEAIFQTPVRELLASLYESIGKKVAARAQLLGRRLEGDPANHRSARKRMALTRVCDRIQKSS